MDDFDDILAVLQEIRDTHRAHVDLVRENIARQVSDRRIYYEHREKELQNYKEVWEKQLQHHKERDEKQLWEYREQIEKQLKEYKELNEKQLREYKKSVNAYVVRTVVGTCSLFAIVVGVVWLVFFFVWPR